VIPAAGAVHVCYCHNPFRFAWNAYEETVARYGVAGRSLLAPLLSRWRRWDERVARSVDLYVANSHTTRERIARYWNREALVVHPPVATSRFEPAKRKTRGAYHVVLSELVAHKRIELAVEAFNRLGRPLVIVGDGPQAEHLRRRAGPSVSFAGRVSDARVAELLRGSCGLVVTATEEFGIAAIEAQAAGRPVIALAEGGVKETVLDGATGVFYDRPEPDALAAAVRACDALKADPEACARNAARFDVAQFEAGMRSAVAEAWARGPERRPRRRRT
jgi:glycosyltransferase involved in cell wall biosynthesis